MHMYLAHVGHRTHNHHSHVPDLLWPWSMSLGVSPCRAACRGWEGRRAPHTAGAAIEQSPRCSDLGLGGCPVPRYLYLYLGDAEVE